MPHQYAGHYAAKHPPGTTPDEKVAKAVRQKAIENKLSCGDASKVAADMSVSLKEVGKTADLLELRIHKCQLGLFGYITDEPNGRKVLPADSVSPKMEEEIRNALVNGRLPCEVAWRIARRLGVSKMEVAAGCETLEIKINPCQLGAF